MKWVMRWLFALVGLALVLAVGAGWYVWQLGADTLSRGTAAGWAVEMDTRPLSVFEETAAKALFAETWNRTGFPCRTIANGISGVGKSMISTAAVTTLQNDVLPVRTLQSAVARASAACQIEAHGDKALLRLWLKHAWIAEHQNVEAASQALLGKPTAMLDEGEAARMVALLYAPRLWQQPDKWAKRAEHIFASAREYVWVGDQLERRDTTKQ